MRLITRSAFFLALCWIPVFATGCSNSFVLMPDVSQLQSIYIQDNWMGISSTSPTVVSYTLQNHGDYFGGQAFFDINGLSTTQVITIPIEKVDSFLKKLATAPIEEGKYEPTFRYTDDYPDIRFHMRFISETVEFSTLSQGEDHSPWLVAVDDKTYISSSHIPMQSFAVLEPYLARDLLNQMIDQRMRQPP